MSSQDEEGGYQRKQIGLFVLLVLFETTEQGMQITLTRVNRVLIEKLVFFEIIGSNQITTAKSRTK